MHACMHARRYDDAPIRLPGKHVHQSSPYMYATLLCQLVLTEAEEQYRLCVARYEAAHGKGGASTRKVGTKLVDNLIAQAKLLEAQDVAKYYRLEWSMRQPKKPVAGSMAGELLGGSVSAIKGFSVDKPGVRR